MLNKAILYGKKEKTIKIFTNICNAKSSARPESSLGYVFCGLIMSGTNPMRTHQALMSFELFCDRVGYRHQVLHVG